MYIRLVILTLVIAMNVEAQNVFVPRMGINENTGVAVSLHNWGGTGCENTADGQSIADTFNCVVSCPSYELASDPELPAGAYDLGLHQAIFALREFANLYEWLRKHKRERGIVESGLDRRFAVGASGGGLVALMMNKLAPQTFSGVFVINPLVGAWHHTEAAKWPRSVPMRSFEIREIADDRHLAIMRRRKNKAVVGFVAGAEDTIATYAQTVMAHLDMALSGIETYFVGVYPGVIFFPFQDAGHSLGDRTYITQTYAGPVFAATTKNKTDFERRSEISFPVTGGAYVVKYGKTSVKLKFVKKRG